MLWLLLINIRLNTHGQLDDEVTISHEWEDVAWMDPIVHRLRGESVPGRSGSVMQCN